MKQAEVSELLAGLVEAQVVLAKSIEATASALVASQGEAVDQDKVSPLANLLEVVEKAKQPCSCQAHRGNKNLGFGSPDRPSLSEVINYAESIGGTAQQAQACYDSWVNLGWRVGRKPMVNWQSALQWVVYKGRCS